MNAQVTQYLRPNGRREQQTTELPDECAAAYEAMRSRGWNFGAEVLTTGHVSLTIEDRTEEIDRNIRIVSNGPGVQAAMVEMLRETFPEHFKVEAPHA